MALRLGFRRLSKLSLGKWAGPPAHRFPKVRLVDLVQPAAGVGPIGTRATPSCSLK